MTDQGAVGRRAEIVAALRAADGPLTVADLATRVHVHPNTVRFHLDALVGSGRVVRTPGHRSARAGRPSDRYEAAPGMDPAGPRRYDVLATVLADALAAQDDDAPARAQAAGHAWGAAAARQAAPAPDDTVAALATLLDGLGFAPEPGTDASGRTTIGLHSCPFLELARSSTVVCPVHLGIMRGALAEWGAGRTVERLQPFARPDLCVAHLG